MSAPLLVPIFVLHVFMKVRTLVTDPEFVARAERLERAITSGDLKVFCEEKVQESVSLRDKQMWNFMKVLFETVRCLLPVLLCIFLTMGSRAGCSVEAPCRAGVWP